MSIEKEFSRINTNQTIEECMTQYSQNLESENKRLTKIIENGEKNADNKYLKSISILMSEIKSLKKDIRAKDILIKEIKERYAEINQLIKIERLKKENLININNKTNIEKSIIIKDNKPKEIEEIIVYA